MNVRGEVTLPGGGGAPGGTGGDDEPFVYRHANDCVSGTGQPTGVICRNDVSVTFQGTDIPWRPITLVDIASFVPREPGLAAEPGDWAVRGLPTNFVLPAERHTVSGSLLGLPAEVRFTPVRWRWDYGDGTVRTTRTGGATWSSLGAERFTPTATSHVFQERGRLTVSASVEYRAEYRFSGPAWGTVEGSLWVSSAPRSLLVVTGSTVLVDRPCPSSDRTAC